LNKPVNSSADIPLEQALGFLLTNAEVSGLPTQYFTEEELELFAVNPSVELGDFYIENLFIKGAGTDGKVLMINNISSNAPIIYLYRMIEQKTGIPINFQRLEYNCKNLHPNYFSTVAQNELRNNSHIQVNLRVMGAPGFKDSPPTHLLDNRYHLDLTNVTDVDQTFYRGGEVYNRPYGWMRFALNLNGGYSDYTWLGGLNSGPDETRTSSEDGEWPVSFHGTGHHNGLTIGSEGLKLLRSKGYKAIPPGSGIFFSTPDVALAELFAHKFSIDGVDYKGIVQSRINPKSAVKLSLEEANGELWMSSNKNDVRPYGFCVRKI